MVTDADFRADQLVPGMLCEYDDFSFEVASVDQHEDNWVVVTPVVGVRMDIQVYENVWVYFIPDNANLESAPYYRLTTLT